MATLAPSSIGGPVLPLRIVGLVTLAMFFNYVDRGSLSVVAPVLSKRYAIDSARMGILLSAFYWTYAAAQPFAGWLVQRHDVRRVLGVGVALWALATMACGVATGFVSLLMLRLLLGIGESVLFPAHACLLARGVPNHLRGRANAGVSISGSLGPSAGTLIGGLMLVAFGWRSVFLALGGVTLLWLIPWTLGRPERVDCFRSDVQGPDYRRIVRQPALWGAAIGQFCYLYQTYMLMAWLPLFLVQSQHRSLTVTALVGAGIFALTAISASITGIVSDRLIGAGGSTTAVRRRFMLSGTMLTGLTMLGASLSAGWAVIVWLALHAAVCGLVHPLMFCTGQTLSGPEAGGRWMGIQNLVGNLAGIAAPLATGFIVQATGSFSIAFGVAASTSLLGLLCWGPMIRRHEPVDWSTARQLGVA